MRTQLRRAAVFMSLARLTPCVALLAVAGPPTAHAQQPSSPPPAAAPATIDLKAPIDEALRWLRQHQVADDGGYGGVEATAWVLRVMGESPRHYRRVDGPFIDRALAFLVERQADDGAIHDPHASREEVARQTKLAAAALAIHADAKTQAALAKALKYVAQGANGPAATEPGWDDEALASDAAALGERVRALLAKRSSDGSWDGPRGRMLETARATALLIRAQPILKPADKSAAAAKPLPRVDEADAAKVRAAIDAGARFLVNAGEKGRYGAPGQPDPGLTAMVVGALLCVPEPRATDVQIAIDSGIEWLVSLQKPDGSIHDGKLANYATSASIMALARHGKPEHKPVIEKARAYLLALQLDGDESYSEDHPFYGGIGYGSSERPDLSNLQMALEALSASGLEKDNAAFQRALKFLERCQNRSESNDVAIPDGQATIVSGDDGGASYGPGQSFAGYVELADGKKVPRSYGSMTYALLKGYAFAGLPKDDPRMRAAWDWLRQNYTLDVNPGFESSSDPTAAYQGLFYYFHTMAKALDLYGEEQIVDAQGTPHAWRKELSGRIVSMQRRTDGSWINENSPRWWEGNPVLATAYALLTLDQASPNRGG